MDLQDWQGSSVTSAVLELLWWAILPSDREVELLAMHAKATGRSGGVITSLSTIVAASVQMERIPDDNACLKLLSEVGHTQDSVFCAVASHLWEFAARGNAILVKSAFEVLHENGQKVLHAYIQLLLYLRKICWWKARARVAAPLPHPPSSQTSTKKRKRDTPGEPLGSVGDLPPCSKNLKGVCARCLAVFPTFLAANVMSTEGQLCADRFFYGSAIGLPADAARRYNPILAATAKIVHACHLSTAEGVSSVAEIAAASSRTDACGRSAAMFLITTEGNLQALCDPLVRDTHPQQFLSLQATGTQMYAPLSWLLELLEEMARAGLMQFYEVDEEMWWRWRWRAGSSEDARDDEKSILPRLLANAWLGSLRTDPGSKLMSDCCKMTSAAADAAIQQADICAIAVLSHTSHLCCAVVVQRKLSAIQTHSPCANHLMARISHEYAVTETTDEKLSSIQRRQQERRTLRHCRSGHPQEDCPDTILTLGANLVLAALGAWTKQPADPVNPYSKTGESECDCLVVSASPAWDIEEAGVYEPLSLPYPCASVRIPAQVFRGDLEVEVPADEASQVWCAHGTSLASIVARPWRLQAITASYSGNCTVDMGVSQIHAARCFTRLDPRCVLTLLELPRWELEQIGCARELPALFSQLMLELFLGDYDGSCVAVYDLKATSSRARAALLAAAAAHQPVVYIGVGKTNKACHAVLRALQKTAAICTPTLFPGWFVGLVVCARNDLDAGDDDDDDDDNDN